MKSSASHMTTAAALVFFFALAGTSGATHQQGGFAPPPEKKLFTKHFQQTLFEITKHAEYSIEILLDDKEYPIGKNAIGIIVHNARDEDVKGAELTITRKDLTTGEAIPATPVITDKHNGLYIVSGLDLKGKGKWQLSVTLKKDGIEDGATFVFPDVLKSRYPKGRYSP
jgi:hypothetical protein